SLALRAAEERREVGTLCALSEPGQPASDVADDPSRGLPFGATEVARHRLARRHALVRLAFALSEPGGGVAAQRLRRALVSAVCRAPRWLPAGWAADTPSAWPWAAGLRTAPPAEPLPGPWWTSARSHPAMRDKP